MTLDFTQTASDCQVARLLAPLMQDQVFYGPPENGRGAQRWWSLRDGHQDSRVQDTTHMIMKLRHQVPEGDFWARTRYRMTSHHGCAQIRRVMQLACASGILRGWTTPELSGCLCRRTYYRSCPAS